jgi:hypothetical protein
MKTFKQLDESRKPEPIKTDKHGYDVTQAGIGGHSLPKTQKRKKPKHRDAKSKGGKHPHVTVYEAADNYPILHDKKGKDGEYQLHKKPLHGSNFKDLYSDGTDKAAYKIKVQKSKYKPPASPAAAPKSDDNYFSGDHNKEMWINHRVPALSLSLEHHYAGTTSEVERDHIRAYTDSSREFNKDIYNEHLHGHEPSTHHMYQRHVLDKYLHSQETPDHMDVWSGIKRSPEHHAVKEDGKIHMLLASHTSTSTSPRIGGRFSGQDRDQEAGLAPHLKHTGKHVLRIKVPKGSPGAFIAGLSSMGRSEHEFLLPSASRLHVHPTPETTEDEWGMKHHVWHAELQPHHHDAESPAAKYTPTPEHKAAWYRRQHGPQHPMAKIPGVDTPPVAAKRKASDIDDLNALFARADAKKATSRGKFTPSPNNPLKIVKINKGTSDFANHAYKQKYGSGPKPTGNNMVSGKKKFGKVQAGKIYFGVNWSKQDA